MVTKEEKLEKKEEVKMEPEKEIQMPIVTYNDYARKRERDNRLGK